VLLERVSATIRQHSLLVPGEKVVVGVSGGPDSLCMLHLLNRLRVELRLALHVAHVDHQLRGADSEADAAFVVALAERWGLPCTVERVDVASLARRQHLAVEEAARCARYASLARVALEVGARTIAVGHNADDQAETVLMHWLRGSGLAGLRGMQLRTPLREFRLLEVAHAPAPMPPDLWLVRPLLETARADIFVYCKAQGLQPRFSNLDTTRFRNWLRHEVIPLLAQHNPRVQEVLRRSASVLADDYALLHSLLEKAWPSLVTEESAGRITFDLCAWRALPASLQRSSLREAVHRLRLTLRNIGFVHVEAAAQAAREGPAGRRATLPQGLSLIVGYDRLTIASAETGEALPDWPLLACAAVALPVAIPGRTRLPGGAWTLEADLAGTSSLPDGWRGNADPWLAYVDAAVAAGPLWLRARRRGDRFRPMGMGNQQVRLSDWMTSQKVPRLARARLPLLTNERGILWVCGQRLDESARVRVDTESVFVLRFAHE
jgi:tRNA(Ile)-lysidine synthetase-like protein